MFAVYSLRMHELHNLQNVITAVNHVKGMTEAA